MKPFLMGSETEYAVSGRNGLGAVSAEEVFVLLNQAVKQERVWVSDVLGNRAMYLINGGRFYMDHGGHPELATPECFTPVQVASYDKANERLLELARARVLRQHPDMEVSILKNNISPDCPDDVTWGNHESYTCWVPLERAAPGLIPHLVSRIIYAGAGCLSAYSLGMGFELSQRARHLKEVTGIETTRDRAIFCTRVRKMSDYRRGEWTRAHLIGKDSHRSPFGIYLTFGTTGLLFLMLNSKCRVGKGLDLADPLVALRTLSCDPWLRATVPLADGRKLTALDIQECYLEECEREAAKGDFPEWADEVLRHWRQTLTLLARDPLLLAGKLDPYTKLFMYTHELRRTACSWSELHQALGHLSVMRGCYTPAVVRALFARDPASLSVEERIHYADVVRGTGADRPGGLERLNLAVRLLALDLSYHEVGGLYDRLAAAGQVQQVVLTKEDVDRATQEPPPGGRASLRSQCIRAFQHDGWVCDWRFLYHAATGEFVDLRDPFSSEFKATSWARLFEGNHLDPDLNAIASQLARI